MHILKPSILIPSLFQSMAINVVMNTARCAYILLVTLKMEYKKRERAKNVILSVVEIQKRPTTRIRNHKQGISDSLPLTLAEMIASGIKVH